MSIGACLSACRVWGYMGGAGRESGWQRAETVGAQSNKGRRMMCVGGEFAIFGGV